MVVLRTNRVVCGGAMINLNSAQGLLSRATDGGGAGAPWLLQQALADWQAP